MKKYLLVVIVFFIGTCGCFVFYSKPILLRTLVGGGRVLFPPLSAEVRLNGEPQPTIKCFKTRSYGGDRSVEMIVVYDSKVNNFDYNEAIVVDLTEKAAGMPNAGEDNYLLFWDYFLFQSESGAAWVPFNSSKFDSFDPKYVFEPKYIKFDLPSRTAPRTYEIFLKD